MSRAPIELISPIQVQSLADHVVEQLERLIVDGRLKPGDQLPSELELSEALRVGRSTVREAKQTLITKGLIVPRGRAGTFVADPGDTMTGLQEVARALRDPSHDDVHRVRCIVEIAAGRLAAERVTLQEIATMRATLADIERQSEEHASASWTRSLEIHRHVVQASGNEVLASIYELIVAALIRNQVPYLPLIADWQFEIESHHRLIDVLAQGDPDSMEAELTAHLAHAERYRLDLLDATALRAAE